jgi:ubiquinone/menaquinone biosynthesis C-methylase UbiE
MTSMNLRSMGTAVLLIGFGMLLGGFTATFWPTDAGLQPEVGLRKVWPPREFESPSGWIYLKVDESGWSTGPAGSFQELNNRFASLTNAEKEIVIPIFPTVYEPKMVDKIYYDAILDTKIRPGDKVLVIGTGSGADAWAAWLKSKAPVYVVEINPVAVANARVTARLGNFEMKLLVGDITQVALPDDFKEFDFVLWNMPFVWKKERLELLNGKMENNRFYDGDDGTVLKNFLTRLPSLLKKGGTAILLNTPLARDFIPAAGMMVKSNSDSALYAIPNP